MPCMPVSGIPPMTRDGRDRSRTTRRFLRVTVVTTKELKMRRHLGNECTADPPRETIETEGEQQPLPPVPPRTNSLPSVPIRHIDDPPAMPQRLRIREQRVIRGAGIHTAQRFATLTSASRVSRPPARNSASASEAQRSPGGYECEFIDPPEDLQLLQTKCPICLLIPRKPFMVTCCCHKFCESCIRQVNTVSTCLRRTRHRPCPLCNAVTYTLVHEKDLERTLNGLNVYCTHRKDGCLWTGELGKLELHLNETPGEGKQKEGCQYVQINCPNDCKKKVQRCSIHEHQRECARRQYSCCYCKAYVSSYQVVKEHHWPNCKSFPIPCPNNCGIRTLSRLVLPGHLESCPLQVVPCEFYHAGCSAKVVRKKLADHVKVNVATHLSLLAQQNIRLMQELEECKSRLTELEGGGRGGRERLLSEGPMDVEKECAKETECAKDTESDTSTQMQSEEPNVTTSPIDGDPVVGPNE